MNQDKVSELIKKIRVEEKMTQKEFADLFHVTYQAVSKWERGVNMPDINTLKEICDCYNLDINDFLSGKKRTRKPLVIVLILLVIFGIGVYFYINSLNKPNYEFKTLTTSCQNFDIKGSIAYNEKSSSIYISDIVYCGSIDNNKYEFIKSSLHENDGSIIIDGEKKENVSIEEYLKNSSFYIEHYNNQCSNNTEYYLEIHAVKKDKEEVIYKIPLNCE